jgi:hypothetical protein
LGGLPSVDFSVVVAWLNRLEGVSVSHEARVFSLLYNIIRSSMLNPWLLQADIAPLMQDQLKSKIGDGLGEVYNILSGPETVRIWGDAHAHYLDPLDKPKFVELFFDCFKDSFLICVLEDPVVSMKKLLARNWVGTAWEAADVVARHLAASERASRDYPRFVCQLNFGTDRNNAAAAHKLANWLGITDEAAIDRLLVSLASEAADLSDTTVGVSSRADLEDRLNFWRGELRNNP